jgi:hypothetical protein
MAMRDFIDEAAISHFKDEQGFVNKLDFVFDIPADPGE